ncbi:MAG: hypothetical protein IKU55_04165, partial [Clostridia bacterium]|nr:hypothetical protein [Clostridia bacterium]
MKFFAVNGTRPIRLSEQTRLFAYESMHHKYGQETWATPEVAMDDIEGFQSLPWLKQYDLAIERIVRTAPIRICEGEKISGAATLGAAISHVVPATFQGKTFFGSVSHLTIDFETVLKQGVNALEQQVRESLVRFRGTEKEAFLESCLHCIRCLHVWHQRYLDALTNLGYESNVRNLQRVPFEPATNFCEAVQSLWFTFAFVRLCGNWPGIGR